MPLGRASTIYTEFRDNASPEIIAGLTPSIMLLKGRALRNAEMLQLLQKPEPAAALLNDTAWQDKNFVLWELSRLQDRRAVPVVARILRDAPKDYFDNPNLTLAPTISVEHALKVVAQPNSPEAVDELIQLLEVDLGRFGGYIDRESFRRIVAAHLIELTGESFGVDATAWQRWHASARRGDSTSSRQGTREE